MNYTKIEKIELAKMATALFAVGHLKCGAVENAIRIYEEVKKQTK